MSDRFRFFQGWCFCRIVPGSRWYSVRIAPAFADSTLQGQRQNESPDSRSIPAPPS